MDYGRRSQERYRERNCLRNLFPTYVFVSLAVLMGLQLYTYYNRPMEFSDGLGDVKNFVIELMKGLTEVNRKHDRLQGEIERVSAVLPVLAASADRAKDAIQQSSRKTHYDLLLTDLGRSEFSWDRCAVVLGTNLRFFTDCAAEKLNFGLPRYVNIIITITDFALESVGAKIVDTGDTVDYITYESPVSWAFHTLTYLLCRECQGATAIITPGSLPGECWAFKGSKGEATIRLPGPVHITAISLEHISPDISPTKEISSAPRLFQVEGLEYRHDPYPHDFGSFEYDKDAKPIQFFKVLHPSPKSFTYVRIRIMTNWGNSAYTCVYRVRVHGELDADHPNKYDDEVIDNEVAGRY